MGANDRTRCPVVGLIGSMVVATENSSALQAGVRMDDEDRRLLGRIEGKDLAEEAGPLPLANRLQGNDRLVVAGDVALVGTQRKSSMPSHGAAGTQAWSARSMKPANLAASPRSLTFHRRHSSPIFLPRTSR